MKKRISLLMALILFIACLSGVVNAANSMKMILTSDSKLVPGDTVVVDFKISEINAGDGIDAIVGTLDYNKNVFEEVTEDNFEGQNRWSLGMYDTETQMFTLLKSSKINLPSDVLKITLRVKDSASADSTTITVKDITTSGGIETGDIEVEDVTITIDKRVSNPEPEVNETVNEVVNETVNEEVNNTQNEITGGNTNTNTNANKINTNTNKNEPAGKLPQTGEGIEVALGIAIISIIAVIAYSKYRNINI